MQGGGRHVKRPVDGSLTASLPSVTVITKLPYVTVSKEHNGPLTVYNGI